MRGLWLDGRRTEALRVYQRFCATSSRLPAKSGLSAKLLAARNGLRVELASDEHFSRAEHPQHPVQNSLLRQHGVGCARLRWLTHRTRIALAVSGDRTVQTSVLVVRAPPRHN